MTIRKSLVAAAIAGLALTAPGSASAAVATGGMTGGTEAAACEAAKRAARANAEGQEGHSRLTFTGYGSCMCSSEYSTVTKRTTWTCTVDVYYQVRNS
jgi:hypothetical protein